MANRDNPHGFRPLMRSLNGGPGAASMGAHKLVGYGTALFIGDAITRVASGTKYTQAISAAITPGTTVIAGVNMTYGALSTATDHLIIPSQNGQVFECQENNAGSTSDAGSAGVVAADINKNANVILGTGSATTFLSGHELNQATLATTNTLDLKIVGVFRSADNAFGSWCRVEVVVNRSGFSDQVVGI